MSPQNIPNDFKELMEARKEAFSSLSKKKIEAYMEMCGIKPIEDQRIFWKGVHIARAAMVDIPMELREKSIEWMLDNESLYSFISKHLSREEQKEQLMHFYEVRYGNELDT